ncbi:MAG: DEAD/DEAH box helicase [bacterium]
MKPNQRSFFANTGNLDLEDLRRLASRRIVRRGLDYARAGRVNSLIASPDRIEAQVVGTDRAPYLLELEHDGEEILCSCNCPFDWEPFCKHAIAALAVHFGLDGSRTGIDDREHEPSLEDQELAVRRRRAVRDRFKIRRVEGDNFFGIFQVDSASGGSYQVEIRSLKETVNRCSCLDHATSMLGTCKHIEAVLASQRKRAKLKFARVAAGPPTVGQILADLHDTPRIRLILPARPTPALRELAEEFFDSTGYFLGDPVDDFANCLSRAHRIRKLVIYHDAIELSERLAAERKTKIRQEEVRRTVMRHGSHFPGVRAELYPFQVEGAAFLAATGRGLLGDDMGLGKTIQAIAATQVLRDRDEVRCTLVVCPASLKAQWAAEIERFTGLETRIVGGPPTIRIDQYRERAPFTIVNYELVLRDQQQIAQMSPELLILDEAQRIRNWRTKTAESIKRIATPFAFVLTGTPLQNRLDDLYSVMQVVDRRVFGPLWAYNEQFVVKEPGRSRILGYRNLDELRRRLAPTVLRRNKVEVKLQLPERIDSRFSVGMTAAQRNFMEEGVATAAMYASIAERRPLNPKELKRLFMAMQMARMACNAAGLVDKQTQGSPKLDEFVQLLHDLCLDEGRKVVVFSEWVRFCQMGARIAKRLGLEYVQLHGSVPTAKRGDLIARFRDDEKCKIFFSTDAGGVGLNLQFASTVINLELPWNPAVLDQRIGRVHRHGQTEPVHVFLLVAEDSFESGLENTLGAKRSIFQAALDQQAEATTVEAPSSCLSFVRTALEAMDMLESPDKPVEADATEGAGRPKGTEETERTEEMVTPVTTATSESDAVREAESIPTAEKTPADTPETALAQKLIELLGPRLRQVLILPSGTTTAVVDKVDAATKAAAANQGVAITDHDTVVSMNSLGDDSPFHSARVVLDRSEAACDANERNRERRREFLRVAERKITAAQALAAAQFGAEALVHAHAGMLSTLRALSVDLDIDKGIPPARLLFEILVPHGTLNLEQAALVTRAEGLATAYADITQPLPENLIDTVLTDSLELLETARREAG